jgi:hypothetical protein
VRPPKVNESLRRCGPPARKPPPGKVAIGAAEPAAGSYSSTPVDGWVDRNAACRKSEALKMPDAHPTWAARRWAVVSVGSPSPYTGTNSSYATGRSACDPRSGHNVV